MPSRTCSTVYSGLIKADARAGLYNRSVIDGGRQLRPRTNPKRRAAKRPRRTMVVAGMLLPPVLLSALALTLRLGGILDDNTSILAVGVALLGMQLASLASKSSY